MMYNVYKGEIAFNKNQNNENTLPEFAKLTAQFILWNYLYYYAIVS